LYQQPAFRFAAGVQHCTAEMLHSRRVKRDTGCPAFRISFDFARVRPQNIREPVWDFEKGATPLGQAAQRLQLKHVTGIE
jgi:hypothetical protein